VQSKSTKTTSREEQEISQVLRYNPLRFVREAYVRFIQGLFYAAPKGWYHWEPDLESTDIVISDENPIKTDTLGKRPGVTCTRAPVALYSVGLDDMLSYNLKTGAKRKTIIIPGTMSINCCSRVPLEAEQLAWIVAEHLWVLRDVMRPYGFYDVGRNISIGSPSAPGSIIQGDGADEWYVVALTSPFQLSRISGTTPLSQSIASSVEMTLRGTIHGRKPQGVPYHGGPEVPYAVEGALAADDISSVGGRVDMPYGSGGVAQHSVKVEAHPLNPKQEVTVRAARPGDPAVRPPSIYGRAVPTRIIKT
jgi:hypothetical protein